MPRDALTTRLYVPGQDLDIELLIWWRELVQLGELEAIFGDNAQPLGGFMRLMTDPGTVLLYTLNPEGNGWSRAAWFVPFLNGGAWSFWLHPTVRRRRDSLAFLLRSLQTGFRHWPLIVGVTTNDATSAQAGRLGFKVVGSFPELLDDGRPCNLFYLSKADFDTHIEDRKWGSIAYGKPTRKV